MAMDAPDGIGDTGDYTLPHQQTPIAADQLKLNQVILSQNHNSETDLRGQADVKYKVSDNFELKFGTKYANKEKVVDASVLVWMPKSSLGIPGSPVTYMNQLEREGFPYKGGFMNPWVIRIILLLLTRLPMGRSTVCTMLQLKTVWV